MENNVSFVATKKQIKLALPLLFDGLGTFEDEEDNEQLNDLMETMERSSPPMPRSSEKCKGCEFDNYGAFGIRQCEAPDGNCVKEKSPTNAPSVNDRDVSGEQGREVQQTKMRTNIRLLKKAILELPTDKFDFAISVLEEKYEQLREQLILLEEAE